MLSDLIRAREKLQMLSFEPDIYAANALDVRPIRHDLGRHTCYRGLALVKVVKCVRDSTKRPAALSNLVAVRSKSDSNGGILSWDRWRDHQIPTYKCLYGVHCRCFCSLIVKEEVNIFSLGLSPNLEAEEKMWWGLGRG